MSRIDGRRFGAWSLRLDAAYCLVLGLLVAAAAPQIAGVVALPQALLVATGAVVALWAVLVTWMEVRLPARLALKLVMGVNVLAASLVAAASLTAAGLLVTLAVVAVALDVALFAGSQAIALRNLDADGSASPTAA